MKKFLYAVAVIATVAIAGWNYQQNKEVELSDLAMANVEALAQREIDPSCENGCIDNGDGCMCHTWYATYDEYEWK